MLLRVLCYIFAFLISFSVYGQEKLIACGHQDYPPFMWRYGTHIEGVGTQVAKEIFRELDIEVVAIHVGNWKRCMRQLQTGLVDLVVAAYITEDRSKFADFSEHYLSPDPTSVLVWKGREFHFQSWKDLIGRRMGSLLGESLGQEFDDFARNNLVDRNVNELVQLFRMLEEQRIDFYPIGHYPGLMQIKRHGFADKITTLEHPLAMNYLHVPISKKSKFLRHLPYLSQRLQDLNTSGKIAEYTEKMTELYIRQFP